ncbi:hypothetical protein ACSBM8_00680 [Sphingomonas sp. ASY06-1R]|uniref:hypothetical protein n=1 Tax=Sphingomonas sp. ASY06-1R TaxID=3445771 RepID=UPI003FA264A3
MKRFDGRSLTLGITLLIVGAGLLLAAPNPLLRYAGGITAFAIGLGVIRRGLRLD